MGIYRYAYSTLNVYGHGRITLSYNYCTYTIIIIIIFVVPYLWIASKVLWTKKLRSLKCYRCIPHRYRGCANSLQQTRKKNENNR